MNGRKIGFFLVATSILFSAGTIAVHLIIHFSGTSPFDLSLALITLLAIGVGIPVFAFLLGAWEWLRKRQQYERGLTVHPFNQLDKIGFMTVHVNTGTRWHYTEEIKAALISNFQFQCLGEKDEKSTIVFRTDAIQKDATMKALKRSEKILEENGFELHGGGYSKKYSLHSPPPSAAQVKRDLEKLCQLLSDENYIPVHYEDIHSQLQQPSS